MVSNRRTSPRTGPVLHAFLAIAAASCLCFFSLGASMADDAPSRRVSATARPLRILSACASPQATSAFGPIVFGACASAGNPPYSFHWSFDDGATVATIVPTPLTTSSVTHTYPGAGTFNAYLEVTDSDRTRVATHVPVYVGCIIEDSLGSRLTVEPSRVVCRPGVMPAAQWPAAPCVTLRMAVLGRFLGRFRMAVCSADRNYAWWYSQTGPPPLPSRMHPASAQSAIDWSAAWTKASTSTFSVSWNCRFDKAASPSLRAAFPATYMRPPYKHLTQPLSVAGQHTAILEYQDAFGRTVTATAPIQLLFPSGTSIHAVPTSR